MKAAVILTKANILNDQIKTKSRSVKHTRFKILHRAQNQQAGETGILGWSDFPGNSILSHLAFDPLVLCALFKWQIPTPCGVSLFLPNSVLLLDSFLHCVYGM